MTNRIFLILTLLCFVWGCESDGKRGSGKKQVNSATQQEQTDDKVKRIKRIFYSLPSPLELTMLFKKEGAEYDTESLHDIQKRNDYLLTNKKALNLGVYGADLSYAGLFGNHQDAIEFFAATQIIAEDLGIGQTFQNQFISRLERNADNKDTLLEVISDFFLENDSYLKDLNRQDVSTYVLAGGWIEGIYLGTSMALNNENTEGIKHIIYGQRNSLENLNVLLENLTDKKGSEWLVDAVKSLEEDFNKLAENEMQMSNSAKEEDGVLKITSDTDVNEIQYSDSTFMIIKDKVAEIRTRIIE